MRAWLTGPASADFDTPARLLRTAGYTVSSPHDAPLDIDIRAHLSWSVETCLAADVVVVLPGWEGSAASGVDVTLAESLGTPVLTLDDALAEEPEALLA